MLKRLMRSAAVTRGLAWVLGWYLWFALSSTRWSVHGLEHVVPHLRGDPCIVAFWHERLPLMPRLFVEARRRGVTAPAHVLVSLHRDGRFIGEVIRRFRLDVVYGSSSRGGAAGMRAMVGLLMAGEFVAITPDGPRGPRRRAAFGVAQIPAMAGVPVLPCAAQTTRRITLKSWDRMVIPLPFGRGHLVLRPTIAVPREGWQDSLPAIAAAMSEAADAADGWCAGRGAA